MRILLLFISLFFLYPACRAKENADSLQKKETAVPYIYKFRWKQLIAPVTLIGMGVYGTMNDWTEGLNREIQEELQETPHENKTIDNIAQYAPIVSTYGLNLLGVKGYHGYIDLTIITGTAYLLMAGTVETMKHTIHVRRPDGGDDNSFPSGHTATAFVGAEILRTEYWHRSPWIGVAGYAAATGVGILRMYNNRHWATDVVAGAGIGILSARAAYWLYPLIGGKLFGRRINGRGTAAKVLVAPTIINGRPALAASITF